MNRMYRITISIALLSGAIACNKGEILNGGDDGQQGEPSTGTGLVTLSPRVYEYRPAPGQFVGEIAASTMAEACTAAEERLGRGTYVSLGAWGGYIVVGFGRSISNSRGGYDFAIQGNPTATSSEPGIVSVMTDSNGDGLPNDQWYELAGSDYDNPQTLHDYAVTYYQPAEGEKTIRWEDTTGQSGTIALNPSYPAWIDGESCRFTGPCLPARNSDTSGNGTYWVNGAFDWGYADNFSTTDRLYDDGRNCFRIADAVDASGQSVQLDRIDFIRIQTGVQAQSGWLGELSTEIFSFSLCQ